MKISNQKGSIAPNAQEIFHPSLFEIVMRRRYMKESNHHLNVNVVKTLFLLNLHYTNMSESFMTKIQVNMFHVIFVES